MELRPDNVRVPVSVPAMVTEAPFFNVSVPKEVPSLTDKVEPDKSKTAVL
jgi:hypothetical protein